MSDSHYLVKVLGLSALPRLVTICLSLITYPLMVRAVGVSEFGVVVYVSAVIAVLESFIDLGVSSAAGKHIAIARERDPTGVVSVLRRWARLQAIVAFAGLVPFLLIAYLVAANSRAVEVSVEVVIVLVLSAWIAIILNFVRASLSSLVAFRSLAALDGFEATVRSATWVAVAFLMPTALGLAIAGLVTAGCSAGLAVMLVWRLARRIGGTPSASRRGPDLTLVDMIRESSGFLWLRLVTRIFQSIPLVMFGRLFGSEVVGVIGAFAKIVEWLNFPFAVIGNALAVRAPGVVAKGNRAVRELWDVLSRFAAVLLMLAATVFLGSDLLAAALLPASASAGAFIGILSITIFTTGCGSVVAPMSDYVGSLRLRNTLLSILAFVQIPIIWLGAHAGGEMGGLIAHACVLAVMATGYVIIAQRAFFSGGGYRVRAEAAYFIALLAVALLIVSLLNVQQTFASALSAYHIHHAFVSIALFWSIVFCGLLLNGAARRFFLTKRFLSVAAL
jgi:O-antigen/teichoic acid export membrane protein